MQFYSLSVLGIRNFNTNCNLPLITIAREPVGLTRLNFEDFDGNRMILVVSKVEDVGVAKSLLEQGHLTVGVLPGPEGKRRRTWLIGISIATT